ncbi:hypothetical protein LZ198_08940 [Myxococcus sp. K15C18031901]|uniref:hypothetical protein n=1 Tax=Myxococcus dinghuensis TaxID=2906761 RepID=UPI0020A7B2B0|nr:hypothetical protein [Myxococcus dinghuensis]MCP3099002.1 hypothetical protein [Myxococcus dinghuensis]
MSSQIPILNVVRILDDRNLILVGSEIDKIREGEILAVLAVGPKIEEIGNVPLVVRKASVMVTTHAGGYIVASSPQEEETTYESSNLMAVLGGKERTKTVLVRRPLAVSEKDVMGNPARRPISIGDPVIRREDLREFVRYLAESMP